MRDVNTAPDRKLKAGLDRLRGATEFPADRWFPRAEIEPVMRLASAVAELEWGEIPVATVEGARKAIAPLLQQLDQAPTADADKAQAATLLRDAIGNAAVALATMAQVAAGASGVVVSGTVGTLRETVEREVRAATDARMRIDAEVNQALTHMTNRVDGALAGIKTAEQQASDALSRIRANLGDATIARYRDHFLRVADEHNRAAARWLWVVAAATVAAVGVVVLVAWAPAPDSADVATYVVRHGLWRVFLVSIAVGFAAWSARIYAAHRHNDVVNRHRLNALTTFRDLTDSVEDPDTRRAVLLHAAQCIFAPQPSGYSTVKMDTPVAVYEFLGRAGKGGP